MVPHANWHHSTARQFELTKYSTYQQQCNGSKCSLWGIKMTTLPKLVEFSFIPYMSVSVIECRSIGSCSSSGLCAGLMITGLHFQLLLTLPSDTELCYNTDKVCFAKTVSPTPVFAQIPGSHHPCTRLRLLPGFRDPGSVLILGQVTQYGNPYLICITLPCISRTQVLGVCFRPLRHNAFIHIYMYFVPVMQFVRLHVMLPQIGNCWKFVLYGDRICKMNSNV